MADIRKEHYPYSEAHEKAYAALGASNAWRDLGCELARFQERLERRDGYIVGQLIIDAQIYAIEQHAKCYAEWLRALI